MKKVNVGKFEIELETIIVCSILIIAAIFGLIYISSPEIYSVTTARYGRGTEEDNKLVNTTFGNAQAEERFKLYFQWYNVVHELGHGVIRYNCNLKISSAEEEQLVNDFAVAYWRHYGEPSKFYELEKTVQYAVNHIGDPTNGAQTYMEYGKQNWKKSSFFTFKNYGWFQFSSTNYALKNPKTFEEVLKEMGITNIKAQTSKVFEYPEINEESSTQIIKDAVNNFHAWGIEFPDVTHNYNDNPNNNYSKPVRNFLGMYK